MADEVNDASVSSQLQPDEAPNFDFVYEGQKPLAEKNQDNAEFLLELQQHGPAQENPTAAPPSPASPTEKSPNSATPTSPRASPTSPLQQQPSQLNIAINQNNQQNSFQLQELNYKNRIIVSEQEYKFLTSHPDLKHLFTKPYNSSIPQTPHGGSVEHYLSAARKDGPARFYNALDFVSRNRREDPSFYKYLDFDAFGPIQPENINFNGTQLTRQKEGKDNMVNTRNRKQIAARKSRSDNNAAPTGKGRGKFSNKGAKNGGAVAAAVADDNDHGKVNSAPLNQQQKKRGRKPSLNKASPPSVRQPVKKKTRRVSPDYDDEEDDDYFDVEAIEDIRDRPMAKPQHQQEQITVHGRGSQQQQPRRQLVSTLGNLVRAPRTVNYPYNHQRQIQNVSGRVYIPEAVERQMMVNNSGTPRHNGQLIAPALLSQSVIDPRLVAGNSAGNAFNVSGNNNRSESPVGNEMGDFGMLNLQFNPEIDLMLAREDGNTRFQQNMTPQQNMAIPNQQNVPMPESNTANVLNANSSQGLAPLDYNVFPLTEDANAGKLLRAYATINDHAAGKPVDAQAFMDAHTLVKRLELGHFGCSPGFPSTSNAYAPNYNAPNTANFNTPHNVNAFTPQPSFTNNPVMFNNGYVPQNIHPQHLVSLPQSGTNYGYNVINTPHVTPTPTVDTSLIIQPGAAEGIHNPLFMPNPVYQQAQQTMIGLGGIAAGSPYAEQMRRAGYKSTIAHAHVSMQDARRDVPRGKSNVGNNVAGGSGVASLPRERGIEMREVDGGFGGLVSLNRDANISKISGSSNAATTTDNPISDSSDASIHQRLDDTGNSGNDSNLLPNVESETDWLFGRVSYPESREANFNMDEAIHDPNDYLGLFGSDHGGEDEVEDGDDEEGEVEDVNEDENTGEGN